MTGADSQLLRDVKTMPEHELPEFNNALQQLRVVVAEAVDDIRDFQAALNLSDLPQVITQEYELRKVLRFSEHPRSRREVRE